MNGIRKGILYILCVGILFSGLISVCADGADAASDSSSESANSVAGAVLSSTGIYQPDLDGWKLTEGQEVTFNAQMTYAGEYSIEIIYLPIEVRNETVDYSLKTDGKFPLSSCADLSLPVRFYSEDEDFSKDDEGNQFTPNLMLKQETMRCEEKDPQGLEYGAYKFSFSKGEHTVSINVTDGTAVIIGIKLFKLAETSDYKDYRKLHAASDSDASVLLDAEKPYERTSKAISEFCDYSSAKVSPEAEKVQVLNAIGGDQWKFSGQDLTYRFTVPEDGYYRIAVNYRQNYKNGRSVYRAVLIDGELPFSQSACIEFPYTGSWEQLVLGGDGEEYGYWLTVGTHTLTFEVTLGEMADIISECREILTELNAAYRRIVSITGTEPDNYRDYRLDEKIPDTVAKLGGLSEKIRAVSDTLKNRQSRGSESGALDRLVLQLAEMNSYPEECATQLKQFQTNISAFGTWINERYNQPLALDSIMVYSGNGKMPSKSFFAQTAHTIRQFIYSFSDKYSVSDPDITAEIDVWALTGRDQVQIIKQLANERFTHETGIAVDLKLVSETAVLPATAAGQGPDICLMVPQNLPINFAIRGAVLNLSGFEGFQTVRERFAEQAMVSFEFDGKTYALPETMTFPMLFYRGDILEELGLAVPETWDDVRQLIIDLSNNNMQFGFTGSEQNYLTMLFQKGGRLYSEDATVCLLDSNTALQTFEEYVSLYSEYGIPVTFDFANRFRSGVMPVAVADYAQYNVLQIFAPEISGLWSIAPVPATETEDRYNYSVAGTVTGCVIFSDTASPQECWNFLEWWTRSDIQEQYGRKVEEKLGASARYAAANKETLKALPWSLSFYNNLSQQMKNVQGVPQIPGSYFTSRHFNNAYRKAVYRSANPRETLIEYNRVINDEITLKRKEFGLNTAEESK